MARYLATTESGTVYDIDLDNWFWNIAGSFSNSTHRIWEFKVSNDAKEYPWIDPDGWKYPGDPSNWVGKHLYISGKDEWRISTKVQTVEETVNARNP